MKKKPLRLFTALMALALLAAPAPMSAQNMLNKLKQKAGDIKSKVGEKVNEKVGTGKVGNFLFGEDSQEEQVAEEAQTSAPRTTPTDQVPKLRQTRVVWDGEVQPAQAADYRALLALLPELPSVEELAAPTEEAQTAYQRLLSSLSLRARELDKEYACSDEEMEALRDKIYKEMEGLFGLTAEEMKRLEDPDITPEEKEKLEAKAQAHLLGELNMEETAGDMEKTRVRLEEIEVKLAEYEKKESKGQLTEKEAADRDALLEEQAQIASKMMGSMSSMMGNLMQNAGALAQTMQKQQQLVQEFQAMEGKLVAYAQKVVMIREAEGSAKSAERIAKDYEADLKGYYSQIWEAKDAAEVKALYAKADDLMANYRLRAAQIHRKNLQTRLDNAKKLMPEAEALYGSMAEDGFIPACATRRAPLNVVIDCINILEEAYAYFPRPEANCCKMSPIRFALQAGDVVLSSESHYAGNLGGGLRTLASTATGEGTLEEDFVRNTQLLVFNARENRYYKLEGSQRTALNGNGPFNFYKAPKRGKDAYGEIALEGGRKAVFSPSGQLTLPDGTVFYPLAMQRTDQWLVFIIEDYQDNAQGFVKCMYRL